MRSIANLLLLLLVVGVVRIAEAQDESPPPVTAPPKTSQNGTELATPSESQPKTTTTVAKLKDSAGKLATQAETEAEKIAKQVDQIPQAKKAAAGILEPIYVVAEALAFPAFHWLAFALMAAGVFSYTLQLVLGKLVVLTRLGFSVKEIASDAVGLAISVVGLVLTTQAAAENSSFTQSPSAVISATVVGAILGIVLYFWGQSQELEAAKGRSHAAAAGKK